MIINILAVDLVSIYEYSQLHILHFTYTYSNDGKLAVVALVISKTDFMTFADYFMKCVFVWVNKCDDDDNKLFL